VQAFHQAELLVVHDQASEWTIADWLTTQAKELFGDRKLMMQEIDFPFMCSRAFELYVDVDGEWLEVAAFGRFHEDIAERLGGPGQRAVGAGIGLERWAQLAYDINDIRKIESTRLPAAAS
jgi:phenylalanyl-tRNA synthetase alpha subunit